MLALWFWDLRSKVILSPFVQCYSGQSLQNCSKVSSFLFKYNVCECHLQGNDNFSHGVRIINEQISHITCFICRQAFHDSCDQTLHLKKYSTDNGWTMTYKKLHLLHQRMSAKTQESLCIYHLKTCQSKGNVNKDSFETPKEMSTWRCLIIPPLFWYLCS